MSRDPDLTILKYADEIIRETRNLSGEELVILAVYMNVGNASVSRAKERMAEVRNHVSKELHDTQKDVRILYIATDQPTRIECIYPPPSIIKQQNETKTTI